MVDRGKPNKNSNDSLNNVGEKPSSQNQSRKSWLAVIETLKRKENLCCSLCVTLKMDRSSADVAAGSSDGRK